MNGSQLMRGLAGCCKVVLIQYDGKLLQGFAGEKKKNTDLYQMLPIAGTIFDELSMEK